MTLPHLSASPLTRRSALLGLTASWSLGAASIALAEAPTEQRFVVVMLRGALDGMAAVVPYGDANLANWRAALLPEAVGRAGGMLDLGGYFGLHPALGALHEMYAQGALLPVHAVAGHYRSRSHFEAQDYMESGADQRMTSGWLNRLVSVLPAGRRGHSPQGAALSVGLSMPLLLRGPAAVGSWAPVQGGLPPPDLYARVAQLNAPDRLTGPAIEQAVRARGYSAGIVGDQDQGGPGKLHAFAQLARACGSLLAAADGPRIAALEIGGWDTHGAQVPRLVVPLSELAAGLIALRDGLGTAWTSTVVLVMTEFGRTVRVNGTGGTDHGTGTVAFALGGRVAGGRVAGSWPGLAAGNLLDDRDLQPTTDLRSLAKGLLAAQFGLGAAPLGLVFPASAGAVPMHGLLRPA